MLPKLLGPVLGIAVALTLNTSAVANEPSVHKTPDQTVQRSTHHHKHHHKKHEHKNNGGRSFYVSTSGSDNNPGTQQAPWQTLNRATQQLSPGDRVFLKTGNTFDGVTVNTSGHPGARITLTAYGKGANPVITNGCVTLNGDYLTVRNIRAQGCDTGIAVNGNRDSVVHAEATDNMTGILANYNATNTTITRNRVFDNRRMAPNTPGPYDDYGAFGVLVNGDHTTVTKNVITGQHAYSADFGQDGSAVEIYGATNTVVDNNVSRDNMAFTELGESSTRNTFYKNNTVTSTIANSDFLVTRGPNDTFGPALGTVATGNNVNMSGSGTQGFWCDGGCTPEILSLSYNNIKADGRPGYADGPIYSEHNVYTGGSCEFNAGKSDTLNCYH